MNNRLLLLLLAATPVLARPVFAAVAQQAYLKASNTGAFDLFGGTSVAVSADTVVVGALYEDSNATGVNGNQSDNSALGAGAAYVFLRTGSNWTQQAYLKASNAEGGSPQQVEGDRFGYVVAVSQDTIVVGAPGESSSAAGVNGEQNDNNAENAGAVYVFVRTGTNWTQQAYLKASNTDADDFFGYSVAVSGDTVVVGAVHEGSNATGVNGDEGDNNAANAGAAYVFVRTGTNWVQQAYLKSANTQAGDLFGQSVAVSGDTILVSGGGGATVFVRNGTNWNQQAYLVAGGAVSISGDTAVAGGNEAVYVFVRSGTNWSQQAYLTASNPDAGDGFGWSVAVSDDTVVVGAPYEDSNAKGVNGNQSNNSALNAGAAYVFVRTGTNWTQQAYLKASNTEAEDLFGTAVAVSDDTVVVGAEYEDSSGRGVNGNQASNSAEASGAAYVFTGVGLPPRITIALSTENVTLSWPVSATNYVLEAATSLPAISWDAVTNSPTVTATNRSVQLPLTGNSKFFRLRKP